MKYIALFPGQGSQSIGMGSTEGVARNSLSNTLDQASTVLGYDLPKLLAEGPADRLNQTEFTQPAILAVSVGYWRALPESVRGSALAVAGHSLGEYSALVAAEVIGFDAALRLVQQRGRLMQRAVESMETAMAAVLGLDDKSVSQVCNEVAKSGSCVQAVNYNCPGQVVIAGEKTAVEEAIAALKEAGARRVMPLPVSVPSHCELMKPAATELAATIEQTDFQAPVIPVYQNVSAEQEDDPEQIRGNLLKQLYSPVLWSRSMQSMSALEADIYLECGPGKVLGGLLKKTDRSLSALPLSDADAWNNLG